MRVLDRAPRAALALQRHGAEARPRLDAVDLLHEDELHHLAAQPDHQDRGEVGVGREAPQRALQGGVALAAIGHAAAGAVGDGDHAVDVRVLRQHLLREPLGDELGDRGRAVHRRQDADIVARADLAVAAHEAAERAAAPPPAPSRSAARPGPPHSRGRTRACRNCGRGCARRVRCLGGEADDLVELADRLARARSAASPPCGPAGMRWRGQPSPSSSVPGQDVDPRHHHIVVRVEADGERKRSHVQRASPVIWIHHSAGARRAMLRRRVGTHGRCRHPAAAKARPRRR